MVKSKMLGFSKDLKWRTFEQDRITVLECNSSGIDDRRYIHHCVIESAHICGFCTIRDKKTKDKIIQSVILGDYDVSNADVYVCVETSNFQDHTLYFIVPLLVDKFLLAIQRTPGHIIVTNDETLFPVDVLHTKDIGLEDRDFLAAVVQDWMHTTGIAGGAASQTKYREYQR